MFLKKGGWVVKRTFATKARDQKGNTVYLQVQKRCDPETEERAKELSNQIESEALGEKQAGEAPPTVAELFAEFLVAKKRGVSQRTHEYYSDIFRLSVAPRPFARLVAAEVGVLDVQRLYNDLQESGASPSAIHKTHGVLSILFNLAAVWGKMTRNPTKGTILPLETKEEVSFLDQKEARRFIAACRTDHKFAILEFALETGMRPQEYCAVRWSDVDLDRGTVRVRQAVTWGMHGGGFRFKDPKTKGSRRTVRISGELVGRLHAQKHLVESRKVQLAKVMAAPLVLDHMKAKGVNYNNRRIRRQNARDALRLLNELDLIFPSDAGGPMSRNNLNKRELAEVLEMAGLGADYSLYSLRHTSITLLLAGGEDVKAIAERCGTSPEMIWKTYGHVLPSMRESALDKLTEILY